MNDLFEEQVTNMTEPELRDIVLHRHSHKAAFITATKKELFKRGIELFDLGKEPGEKSFDNSSRSKESWNWFLPKWKQNIVNDSHAPQLYSRQVLNIFSILFSVLFGGVLLSINLKTVNNQKKILPVLIFCLSYTILTSLIIGLMWSNFEMKISIFMVLLNAIGATFLYNHFWAKYIGTDFKYRAKPIWLPLIIGIVLASLLIWALLSGQ
jgi:hypothetical protein